MRLASFLVLFASLPAIGWVQPPTLPNQAEALHSAVRAGKTGDVQRFLASGVSIDALDGLGSTPLHDASWTGDAGMVRFLIEHGADVNARHSGSGSTPLY